MGAIVNQAAGAYGGNAVTNRALDAHGRHGIPPALLHNIHTALFNGVHNAYLTSLCASVLGLLVVLNLPGGSARDHQFQEPEAESAPLPVAAGARGP